MGLGEAVVEVEEEGPSSQAGAGGKGIHTARGMADTAGIQAGTWVAGGRPRVGSLVAVAAWAHHRDTARREAEGREALRRAGRSTGMGIGQEA